MCVGNGGKDNIGKVPNILVNKEDIKFLSYIFEWDSDKLYWIVLLDRAKANHKIICFEFSSSWQIVYILMFKRLLRWILVDLNYN